MTKRIIAFTAAMLIIIYTSTYAHQGRLDKNGGHKKNSDGTYHYHVDGDRTTEYESPPDPSKVKPKETTSPTKKESDTVKKESEAKTTDENKETNQTEKNESAEEKPTESEHESVEDEIFDSEPQKAALKTATKSTVEDELQEKEHFATTPLGAVTGVAILAATAYGSFLLGKKKGMNNKVT